MSSVVQMYSNSMRNCVTVARMTLTHFVWVRILVPQPKKPRINSEVFYFSYFQHLFWDEKTYATLQADAQIRFFVLLAYVLGRNFSQFNFVHSICQFLYPLISVSFNKSGQTFKDLVSIQTCNYCHRMKIPQKRRRERQRQNYPPYTDDVQY